jgi:nitric oxide reductase NorE protein
MSEAMYTSELSSTDADIGGEMSDRDAAIAAKRWIPGEVGIWVFLLTDMSVFAVYFCIFLYQRGQEPLAFAQGHEVMSKPFGAFNTFLMLTASLFVALAVQVIRQGKGVMGRKLLLGAGVCGAAFIVNKFFEWNSKIDAGFTPNTNHFFQLYYILTAVHLLHVVVAMVVLCFLWRLAGQVVRVPTLLQARFLENGASYWHLVDLLWLVLFALFYLVS